MEDFDTSTHRKCKKCDEVKALVGGFHKDRYCRQGYKGSCKDCERKVHEARIGRKLKQHGQTRTFGYKRSTPNAYVGIGPTWNKKSCGSCSSVKFLEDFHKDPRCTGGRKTECKECQRKIHEERLGRKITPHGQPRKNCDIPESPETPRERMGEVSIPKISKAEKARIREETKKALHAGIISRQPCEACGSIKSEAHHDDYTDDYILDVVWLCRKHHSRYHSALFHMGIRDK